MASFMKEFKHLEIQLEDIISATNNFNESKVIGCGGFGKVYKGELSHSQSEEKSLVAIKRLDRKYGQGDPEFFKEIRMLSCYRHENLISLLGFCKQEGEMILIYEYASRGSLDRYLSSADLTWTQRLMICIDAAKGLSFLHDPNGTQQRVLHCDIKSANILLDDNMNAKVSDFGLSKMGPAEQKYSLLITNAVGTQGYCDPLYMETYSLTKESDVYSFGVVLFEVLCGRLCFEINNGKLKVLVPFWKESYEQNRLNDIMLRTLMQQIDQSSLETFASIAYQCLHKSRKERPTMFHVVEKLESALASQKLHDFKLLCGYVEILNVADPPLKYNSIKELKALLSNGFLINNGKKWFCINDKGQHIERVYIEECLYPYIRDYDYTLIHPYQVEDGYESDSNIASCSVWEQRYSKRFWNPDYDKDDDDDNDKDEEKHIYDSRYPGGSYYEYKSKFTAFVRAQYLSPQITYTVTLVFNWYDWNQREFIIIRYKLARETKVIIVYDTDESHDGWFMAPLYQFTSQDGTADLEIEFEHCRDYLTVAGIEFHPFEEKVDRHDQVLEEYQDILKAASHYLVYRSIVELEVLLSKGVLLNGYETWLSLNRKGERCEMVSIASFLIPDEHHTPSYVQHDHSRFPAGLYKTDGKGFKTHVRTQFLSPRVTYSVILVFHSVFSNKRGYVDLKYKLEGETKISSAHFANKREDGFYVAELYQLTSNGRTVDLDIVFDNHKWSIEIEGIMFEALEKVDHQVPRVGNRQLSDNLHWTKKKHRYSNLLKWLHIHDGQEWFSADINGKKGLMLSAQAACVTDKKSTWESSPESRFVEELLITGCYKFDIVTKIRHQLLSRQTAYATYLVYKLPQDQSLYEDPLKVYNLESRNHDPWYIYLVSPPNTPILIRGEVDENNHNPVNRPNLNIVPQQRSDGWMEVKVWEFRSETTTKTISMNLELSHPGMKDLHELRVQRIELRPI